MWDLFVPYRELSRFAGNLATCHEAGLDPVSGLQKSASVLTRPRFRQAVETAVDRLRAGEQLSTALAGTHAPWPAFFTPLIEAGEQTGRLEETFRYLERHCRILAGPALALRNAWLFPLVILLAGSVARISLIAVFGSTHTAMVAFASSLKGYALLALLAAPFVTRPCKPLVDPLKLALPLVGAVERELGLNRFFHALAMLYAAGGQRVEAMIRFAARTVPNLAVRADVLRATSEIERGCTIAEAFQRPRQLSDEQKGDIAAGDLSGTLERSFDRIADATGDDLQHRLELFQQFSVRLTMYAVIGSIAFTLLGLSGSLVR